MESASLSSLQALIELITPPALELGEKAQAHLDNLTKPQGSLGRLEELARAWCVMRGTLTPSQPRPAVAVFAADHGVALSGVSPFPREVTAQMVHNFLAGGAGINVLARQVGAQVTVVDVGVDHDFGQAPGLVAAKVARGTANFLEVPAMTLEQTQEAIMAGARVAGDLIDQGADLLIPGEMGIGNTTPSAALAAAFTGLPPAQVTGRGAGVDDAGLARKIQAIDQALALHQPDPGQPLQVLACLGGLEIAAICGLCLMAASRRVPVMLDGLISTAGALCAARLCPATAHYYFAGHFSVEVGHRSMVAAMGLRPLLDLGLRLGEGTGAAVAVNLLKAAIAIYNEMATFASAGVSNPDQ